MAEHQTSNSNIINGNIAEEMESREFKSKGKASSEKKIEILENKKERYIELAVSETKKIKIELNKEKELTKISIETEQRNLEKKIPKDILLAILSNSIKIKDAEVLSEKSLQIIKKEGISSFPLILTRLIPKSENIPKEIFESSKQALKSIDAIKRIYLLKKEFSTENAYIEAYVEEFLKTVEKLTKIENPYKNNSNKVSTSKRFLLSKEILGYSETIKIIRKIENLTDDPSTILKLFAYSLSIRNKDENSDIYNFIHIDTTNVHTMLSLISNKLPTKTFTAYQIPFTPHKEEPKKIFSEEFITKSIYSTIIKHYISNTYKPLNIVFDSKELRMKIGNTGVYFEDKAEYLQTFYSLYLYETTGIFITKTSADSKIINYHYIPVINGKFLDQNMYMTGEELLSKDTKPSTKFLLFVPHMQIIET
jgi:hypothetical protein